MAKIFSINLTFAEESANFTEVETWLKEVGLPIATNSESGAINGRLLKIIDVPGDPDFLTEGRNISLQLDFASLQSARDWLAVYSEPLTEGYQSTFDRPPLCFTTILEKI